MKTIPAWVSYSAIRLLTIAVPLAILLILRVNWVIATIAAVLIGLCLSYIFLRKQREATARELYAISTRGRTPVTLDDDVEDAAIDAAAEPRTANDPEDLTRAPALEREGERGAERETVRKPDDTGQLEN